MEEMQYLIECSDNSLCVIYKHSILFKKNKKITKDMEITFLWPEDTPNAEQYQGRIIETSRNESELLQSMQELVKKRKKGTMASKGDDSKDNKNQDGKSDSKQEACYKIKGKQVHSLADKQIFEELAMDTEVNLNLNKVIESPMINDNITNLRLNVDSCYAQMLLLLDKLKSISDELEKLDINLLNTGKNDATKTLKCAYNCEAVYPSTSNTSGNNIKRTEIKRRSFNMPEPSFEDYNTPNENMPFQEALKLNQEMSKIISNFKTPQSSIIGLSVNEGEESKTKRRSFNMPEPSKKIFDMSDEEDMPFQESDLKLAEEMSKIESKRKRIYVIDSSDEDEPTKKTKLESNNEIIESEDISKIIKEETLNNIEMDVEGLWTLNYTAADKSKGIIELIQDSGVYVKSFALKNVQETQTKQTGMARALMKLVFREKFFHLCSLKGRSANGKGKCEDTRPGLNQDGVTAILAYTRAWAKKNDWKSMDNQTVSKSMAQMLIEYKEKKRLNQLTNVKELMKIKQEY